ncbi:MAG TPA: DUF523 domain-containing protein [Rectinemataceae bacterium]|nr:DUF523 domain-containing protein [Rectinemataceae bacterium]
MKLVSACLLGIKCNYRAEGKAEAGLVAEFAQGGLFPVCPEILGGLGCPRHAAEIVGGGGAEVLRGEAKVLDSDGEDLTSEFLKGAYAVLAIARSLGAEEAILIEKSPSCGCGWIFDGSFSHRLIEGDGVTAALLKQHGIRVRVG